MILSNAEKQQLYRDRQKAKQDALITGLNRLMRELTAEGHPALAGRIERLLKGFLDRS